MGAAVAAVVVVAGGVVVLTGAWPGAPVPTPAAAAPVAPAVAPESPPSAPSGAAPTSEPASPGQRLATQVALDRPMAESLVGRWVPQIGSKAVGTSADGIVYDEQDIWEQYRAVRASYPAAVLVRSDDYTSFRRGGFWVILVAAPHSTAEEANRWCAAAGRSADDCFAKRLSHTEGPQGNTAQR